MPIFVGRSAGLITQPSTHELKFLSPVPSNPMLIPAFIQREVAPLTHTHSQGDITGSGANASAARRALFVSVRDEVTFSNSASIRVYLEVRNGLSAKQKELWLIEAWLDSVNPPVEVRGLLVSTAIISVGKFFANGDNAASTRDKFFHTTSNGSAIIVYGEQSTITDYLGIELVSPLLIGGSVAFTGP